MHNLFLLFNIGGGELIFIILMVIMVFGAKKIPEIARGLGKGIKEVRNATNEIKSQINNSVDQNEDISDLKKSLEEGKKEIDEITGSIKRSTKF